VATQTKQERDAFLAQIKADFDERLAKFAADPQQWLTFIDQVAVFGARYSLGNQPLLMMQAEQRGITPQFFLPYGKKDGSTGWLKHKRQVRKGKASFKVWVPIKRPPTEEQASEWEAAGRKARRDPDGRPAVQVVGFRLASTFELSQTDGEFLGLPRPVSAGTTTGWGDRCRHRKTTGREGRYFSTRSRDSIGVGENSLYVVKALGAAVSRDRV
jgi:hypothetical protein